jgi:amino acid transporter
LNQSSQPAPHIGLFGAVTVGVGAIVGGGVMVMAGPAFAASGPSALLAFLIEGFIALLTAMSFAEMVSAFPESGGAYSFASKVTSVRWAFVTGWVVWFAHVVAGVMYAFGFGAYAADVLARVAAALGWVWLADIAVDAPIALALIATGGYALSLVRSAGGDGRIATWGKVALFAVLIASGTFVALTSDGAPIGEKLAPFFSGGGLGLISTVGLTFIVFQGFEIIATMAGEVKDAQRTVPRGMFLSLAVALAVYMPLLFVIATAGVPDGEHISTFSEENTATVFAVAVQNYLGAPGYWLAAIAAILATLSALHANLLAASRIALRMAEDRTLPWIFGLRHPRHQTPTASIFASALTMAALLMMVPDLTTAGAAASLIFLVSFAFAHAMSYLARRRITAPVRGFRSPFFPLVPIVGGGACAGLALFQALSMISAGAIALVWVGFGALLYLSLFARRAEVLDAATEARDPELTRLRGRRPTLLVPISNPEHAASMAAAAAAVLPRRSGRMWLLSVVPPSIGDDGEEARERFAAVQRAQSIALTEAVRLDHNPEALVTVAKDPWREIQRVAQARACGSILLGLSSLDAQPIHRALEDLVTALACDLVVLRAPPDWELSEVPRIVVPLRHDTGHEELRARLLARLQRLREAQVTYLCVLDPSATDAQVASAERAMRELLHDEVVGAGTALAVRSDDVTAEIVALAGPKDLVVVGMTRRGRHGRAFGELARDVAARCQAGLLLFGRR